MTKVAKQTTTASKKARKAGKAAQTAPAKNGRIIKRLVRASGGDTVAELHDGSTHNANFSTIQRSDGQNDGSGISVKVGMNYDTLKAQFLALQAQHKAKPVGKLANGLDGRNAPHSAKAVSDNRSKAASSAKAGKPAKAEKKAAAKAARAAKAAPKADDKRRIKVLNKKFTYGGEGTARRASWDAAAKSATVQDYLKAGGKAKYLPRFVSAGAIQLVG